MVRKGQQGGKGESIVRVRYLSATPEQVLENRRQLEEAIGSIMSTREQKLLQAKVRWGEKPAHYGETRICRGEEVIYPEKAAFDDLPQWAQEAIHNWRKANT